MLAFENQLVSILNYTGPWNIEDELQDLAGGFGYYFEMGHHWNIGFCPLDKVESLPSHSAPYSQLLQQPLRRAIVTGSSTMAALEASHIKSWADSNDIQRLDPNNGLLLTANLHKLFDAGLISFDDSGRMLVSSKLSQSEQDIFGVVGRKLSKKPSPETAEYLSYHRTKYLE